MTFEDHKFKILRPRVLKYEGALIRIVQDEFDDVQSSLDAAIADEILASKFPPELRAFEFLRRGASGDCYLSQLSRTLDRDNWR